MLQSSFYSVIFASLLSIGDAFEELGNCILPPFECPNPNITFWLYTSDTQENPHQLDIANPETINRAKFVPDVPVILLIHGYTGHKDYAPNPEIRPAYFERGEYNVISMDYNPLVLEPCYVTAVLNVPLVGRCAAQMVDELVTKGIPLQYFHVVGFSLGAQVAGEIANWLKSGKLDSITGLDPALPLFVTADTTKKLDKTDAKFVDVIHTNAMEKGKMEACGHVDFYVNGGMTQPGCKNQTNMTESSCNHWRAPVYFGESINTKIGFYGRRCASWMLYILGWCEILGATEEMIMGEYTPNTAEGLYFVETNDHPPFAQGHLDQDHPEDSKMT